MGVYIAEIESWEPLRVTGLPEGRIRGAVKLMSPPASAQINMRDIDDSICDMLAMVEPQMTISIPLGRQVIDMEGLDVSREELMRAIEAMADDFRELTESYKRGFRDEFLKMDNETQRLIVRQAVVNSYS